MLPLIGICVGEEQNPLLICGCHQIFTQGAEEIDLHASSKSVKETQEEVEQLREHFHAKVCMPTRGIVSQGGG